ncbi:Rossmann-like and DUF2520 domain-containing protein [Caulobacter sp.]|uniref:Rossmann-like and DUF2520 domain-containing protein n=1 Tax=Caulobacter sp. TaxID=78 RepID=UPI001B1C7F9E|nr:Rossmann-like and DUF2520 domain-containing protein [Caulobacter sp.]MBO9543928.1 DUF2520 domain-containing protein [Caulobacter sp.]
MARLWIIGPGAVGRTLGRLLHTRGAFEIAGIAARTPESAQAGRAFIGGGAVMDLEAFTPSPGDAVMLSVRDEAIGDVAARLAEVVDPVGLVIFHCSGARDLEPLAPLRGAALAALHPVKAFADPAREVATFEGVVCTVQGDAAALEVLAPAVTAIGGEPVVLAAGVDRRLYHAGAVFASNYLTTLVQAALDAHAAAGIGQADSLRILSPILRDALASILERGPVQALTGPIARGDAVTVAAQAEGLAAHDPALSELYLELGRRTLDLSRRKSPDLDLTALAALLGRPPGA